MTIYQQAGLQVNAHDSAPVELLSPLRQAGYTRVELLLNALRQDPPLAPPSRAYCDSLKRAGFNVYGVVWADSFTEFGKGNQNDCAAFVIMERKRLNLNGFVMNAEDAVEACDQGLRPGFGGWSNRFTEVFRYAFPKLPLYLNTYIGCGGIDLPAWEKAGARLLCQTHHEGSPFEWGMVGYQAFAKKYGWKNPASVKPQWGVYKGSNGQRADYEAQVASAVAAKCVGFSAYYAEGCFDEPSQMTNLWRDSALAGVVK